MLAKGPHPRLDLKRRQIRLLQIAPDREKGRVSCHLECFDLNSCPEYTALSYRWGDPRSKKRITLQGEQYKINLNLADFLLAARCRGDYGYLWIDALCINQDDKREKNHQVHLMSWIYYQAQKVVVWLGNGELNPESPDRWSYDDWLQLCQNEYWSRVWIVQEIMFAHDIVVRNGVTEISWNELSRHFEWSAPPRSEWLRPIGKATEYIHSSHAATVFFVKAKWHSTPNREQDFALYELLQWFAGWESKNTRDRVFALCGLATGKTRIEVDYAKSVKAICRELRQKILSQHRNGDRLGVIVEVSRFCARILLVKDVWSRKEMYKRHRQLHNCPDTEDLHHVSLQKATPLAIPASIHCPGRGWISLRELDPSY
jgi:hypothetical protein